MISHYQVTILLSITAPTAFIAYRAIRTGCVITAHICFQIIAVMYLGFVIPKYLVSLIDKTTSELSLWFSLVIVDVPLIVIYHFLIRLLKPRFVDTERKGVFDKMNDNYSLDPRYFDYYLDTDAHKRELTFGTLRNYYKELYDYHDKLIEPTQEDETLDSGFNTRKLEDCVGMTEKQSYLPYWNNQVETLHGTYFITPEKVYRQKVMDNRGNAVEIEFRETSADPYELHRLSKFIMSFEGKFPTFSEMVTSFTKLHCESFKHSEPNAVLFGVMWYSTRFNVPIHFQHETPLKLDPRFY